MKSLGGVAMKGSMVDWMKGRVEVELHGGDVARFLNEVLSAKLALANIRWTSSEVVRFEVSLAQYFALKKYIRVAGSKMRLIRKEGFPFLLNRIEKRIWFSVGVALFFSIIFVLSSLVWTVEVEGNERIPKDEIIAAAKAEGLYPLQWSFRLQDTDIISKSLVNAIPGTNWIGVVKEGTKVKIQVVEMTIPEVQEKYSPRHLVATNDAVITYIIAEEGKPLVRKNNRVKKGQTLISGIIGTEAHSEVVVAKGKVTGLVWYEYKVSSPLIQKYRAYTGDRQQRNYFVIGNRAMQISGYGQTPYEKSEVLTTREQLHIGPFELPLGTMKEVEHESDFAQVELTVEQAKLASLEQARINVRSFAGEDARIVSEIVLHEETDNGKVVMKVLFEVNQLITKELPIVQMQGD